MLTEAARQEHQSALEVEWVRPDDSESGAIITRRKIDYRTKRLNARDALIRYVNHPEYKEDETHPLDKSALYEAQCEDYYKRAKLWSSYQRSGLPGQGEADYTLKAIDDLVALITIDKEQGVYEPEECVDFYIKLFRYISILEVSEAEYQVYYQQAQTLCAEIQEKLGNIELLTSAASYIKVFSEMAKLHLKQSNPSAAMDILAQFETVISGLRMSLLRMYSQEASLWRELSKIEEQCKALNFGEVRFQVLGLKHLFIQAGLRFNETYAEDMRMQLAQSYFALEEWDMVCQVLYPLFETGTSEISEAMAVDASEVYYMLAVAKRALAAVTAESVPEHEAQVTPAQLTESEQKGIGQESVQQCFSKALKHHRLSFDARSDILEQEIRRYEILAGLEQQTESLLRLAKQRDQAFHAAREAPGDTQKMIAHREAILTLALEERRLQCLEEYQAHFILCLREYDHEPYLFSEDIVLGAYELLKDDNIRMSVKLRCALVIINVCEPTFWDGDNPLEEECDDDTSAKIKDILLQAIKFGIEHIQIQTVFSKAVMARFKRAELDYHDDFPRLEMKSAQEDRVSEAEDFSPQEVLLERLAMIKSACPAGQTIASLIANIGMRASIIQVQAGDAIMLGEEAYHCLLSLAQVSAGDEKRAYIQEALAIASVLHNNDYLFKLTIVNDGPLNPSQFTSPEALHQAIDEANPLLEMPFRQEAPYTCESACHLLRALNLNGVGALSPAEKARRSHMMAKVALAAGILSVASHYFELTIRQVRSGTLTLERAEQLKLLYQYAICLDCGENGMVSPALIFRAYLSLGNVDKREIPEHYAHICLRLAKLSSDPVERLQYYEKYIDCYVIPAQDAFAPQAAFDLALSQTVNKTELAKAMIYTMTRYLEQDRAQDCIAIYTKLCHTLIESGVPQADALFRSSAVASDLALQSIRVVLPEEIVSDSDLQRLLYAMGDVLSRVRGVGGSRPFLDVAKLVHRRLLECPNLRSCLSIKEVATCYRIRFHKQGVQYDDFERACAALDTAKAESDGEMTFERDDGAHVVIVVDDGIDGEQQERALRDKYMDVLTAADQFHYYDMTRQLGLELAARYDDAKQAYPEYLNLYLGHAFAQGTQADYPTACRYYAALAAQLTYVGDDPLFARVVSALNEGITSCKTAIEQMPSHQVPFSQVYSIVMRQNRSPVAVAKFLGLYGDFLQVSQNFSQAGDPARKAQLEARRIVLLDELGDFNQTFSLLATREQTNLDALAEHMSTSDRYGSYERCAHSFFRIRHINGAFAEKARVLHQQALALGDSLEEKDRPECLKDVAYTTFLNGGGK